jgi:hypothetical protein
MRVGVFAWLCALGLAFCAAGARAVPVTLTDTITQTGDTLLYPFTGLPTTATGDGRLTIATTGTGVDGIDLGDSGEFMDVFADGLSLGRWECSTANDGGAIIPGGTGGADCLFSLLLDIAAPDLAGLIADGAVSVTLAMGPATTFFTGDNDEIAVTLDYLPAAVVPLPATVPLLAAGFGALVLLRRRR